ncbi:ATP-binding protein [Streptomyces sp. NPDC086835]|uniref:ATP-binding protein n=1 Tax=Streptomyces sp. NPDC086835 TaxID=3365761 RepID=UPI0038200155
MLALPAEGCYVATVRGFTRRTLMNWKLDESYSVVLVIDELATNAVQHGGSDMILGMSLVGPHLRIELIDYNIQPLEPAEEYPDSPDEHGRGLGIVRHLTERFGMVAETGQTRVYAVIQVGATDGDNGKCAPLRAG